MLPQKKPLIGGQHHDGVFGDPLAIELVEDPADILVERLHTAEVVVHVAVVAPADERIPLRLGLPKRGIARFVIGIPGGQIGAVDLGRGHKFGVERRKRAEQAHIVVGQGPAAA